MLSVFLAAFYPPHPPDYPPHAFYGLGTAQRFCILFKFSPYLFFNRYVCVLD